MNVARLGVCIAVAVLGAGCFSYVPAEFDTIPPGEHVRVWVTRDVVNELEDITEVRTPSVRGVVMRRDDDGLFVRIPMGVRQDGFHSASFGQDFLIPSRGITQLERRQFDALGTSGLVAGTIGGAAVIIFYIMKAFGEEEEEPECTDCADLSVPIFSLPFR